MWHRLHEYNEELLYDTVDELGKNRIVLYHDGMYFPLDHISSSIHTLAKSGDYYYHIVPEIILP